MQPLPFTPVWHSPVLRALELLEEFVDKNLRILRTVGFYLDQETLRHGSPPFVQVKVYTLRRGAYVLQGKWGPGETAASGLLEGFAVRVEEVLGD
jgi:hypothetical protein